MRKNFVSAVAYSNPLTQFQITGDGYSPLLLGNDVWRGEQLQRGLARLARHSSLPGQLGPAGWESHSHHVSCSAISQYFRVQSLLCATTCNDWPCCVAAGRFALQDYPDWMLLSAFLCCLMFLLCGLPGNIITILGKNIIIFCTQVLN